MTFVGPFQIVPLGVTLDSNVYWVDPINGNDYWYNFLACHWGKIGNWWAYSDRQLFIRIVNIMGTQ